ncbi:ATP-grasp domain-containing protein [Hyalangium gracile]|uniref:ATP-grasp domain-containing protein n=1 Tax=Hyalangium gracile TaxID=394092 RepID=UPI001CCD1ACD|nr:ATP-grasp domain-containing protein [Hyalangium gracile]
MSARHFVFVESNTTGTGRLAVERLLEQQQRVTFVTRQPGKYPFLARQAASPTLRVVEVETNEAEAVTASLTELHAREPIDALLTFSTFYVPLVATLAARLGLRYLNPRTALICHEKYEARKVLREKGLPTPEFWLLTSEEEALEVRERVTYPCVIKPPAESGSTGVRQVKDRAEFLEHYRALSSRKVNERGQPLPGHVLVESLLKGPEFSVETVTLAPGDTRIIGVTRKYLSPPPHFVEMGHDFPAGMPAADRQALEKAALAALEAVGFDLGPAHTEIRLCPQGPVVIEINPRLAGGMIPELVRLATGVDLLEVLLDQLLGKPVDPSPRSLGTASIRFLTSNRRGRLTAVHGVEEARKLETVRELSVDKGPGTLVRPPESATDRLGYIIASGMERPRVQSEVDQALSLVKLDVDTSGAAT